VFVFDTSDVPDVPFHACDKFSGILISFWVERGSDDAEVKVISEAGDVILFQLEPIWRSVVRFVSGFHDEPFLTTFLTLGKLIFQYLGCGLEWVETKVKLSRENRLDVNNVMGI